MNIKNLILDNVADLVSDLLYYDRKEDEALPRGRIEEAIKNGDISIKDIESKFSDCLRDGLCQLN